MSVFLNISEDRVIYRGDFFFMIYDAYPVSKNHLLIISNELREYGFNSSEDIIGDFDPKGISEEEPLDGFNEITRRNTSTGNIINEVLSEIEDEEIAKLSPLDYLRNHLELN